MSKFDIKGGGEIFTEAQELAIKNIMSRSLPEEQKKCDAFRIFHKEENVEKLFDGFNRIDNLISALKEHKISHTRAEIEIKEIQKKYVTKEEHNKSKKWRSLLSFLGGIVGGYGGSHIPKG